MRLEIKYLEDGRTLVQGIMILIGIMIANWISLPFGMLLVAFIGIMKIQQCFTDWCVPDPFLQRLGFKRKYE